MGPYPHEAPPATISARNPVGTDGFEFVEFAHPDPAALTAVCTALGFERVAEHRSKAISLWRQGGVNFIANGEPHSHAATFAAKHGPCAASMGWRVVDAQYARAHAIASGAQPADPADGSSTIDAPAIAGIGGSRIYFIDRPDRQRSVYGEEFIWTADPDPAPAGAGLFYIDHLTHNVARGRMDVWSQFYERLFGFRQIRYFDIAGKLTGLYSRAMTSPCGKIRIPINESADDRSQIEEYLRSYKGEGIQHVACGSRDIYATVDALRARGLPFMPAPPPVYYERIDARVAGHGESIARLAERGILIDGEAPADGAAAKILLQIFSGTVLGPIFFEFIERKGDDGFGEGNFRALFESIEEDQIRRGTLTPAETAR